MRAIRVIVRDVVLDESEQVSLVEDEDVIQKISATTSDPAFRHSILPRACRAYASGFHAAGCQQIGYLVAELAVTIENRALWTSPAAYAQRSGGGADASANFAIY